MDPETCGHDDRENWRVDSDGLPEVLYWEADCADCGAVISLQYEPTGEALIHDPESGEYWEDPEFWFYNYDD